MMVDLDPSGQVTQREPDRAQRQYLNYAFYKLDPMFRRLPRAEQVEMKAELQAAIEGWTDAPAPKGLIQRTYSTVGTRPEADFMLWRIAFDLADFQEAQARVNRTRMGGYLAQPHNYISMQKRSQYVNRIEGSGHGLELLPERGQLGEVQGVHASYSLWVNTCLIQNVLYWKLAVTMSRNLLPPMLNTMWPATQSALL